MRQRFGSLSSHPSLSTPITDEERAAETNVHAVNLYDPYADYGRPVAGSGYIPARSESPSRHSRDRMAEGTYTSGASRHTGSALVPDRSSGSTDPLLSGPIPPQAIPQPYTLSSPTVPPRNPKRMGGQEGQSQESAGGSGSRHADERPPPEYRAAGGRDKKPGAKG